MTKKIKQTTKKQTVRSAKVPKMQPKRLRERVFESDSTYFLKLVVVLILGTLWLKFQQPVSWQGFVFTAFPLGIIVGFLLVRYFEKHQTDRKIWYAVLLVVGVISYFSASGIVL